MKKVVCFLCMVLFLIPIPVYAQRGCCSHHGGVSGSCSASGKQICNDGTVSKSCTCSGGGSTNSSYNQPRQVISYTYGCTDSSAINYNPSANKDDGSCIAKKSGCMKQEAINYDSTANVADGSCQFKQEKKNQKEIKYKTKYKEDDELLQGMEKVSTKGVNGKKEIIYSEIIDENGQVLSKEKVSEKVIQKPVTEVIAKGTAEASPVSAIIVIGILVFVVIYSKKHRDINLLINKIANCKKAKILLYILYFFTGIPVMIDFVLIIINMIKNIRPE